MKCHLRARAHKGSDGMINKIKERYYWASCYKEMEEKVQPVAIDIAVLIVLVWV